MIEGFSAKLKLARKAKHLTQGQLGQQLGIAASAISQWETDVTGPSMENLRSLALMLGSSVDYLLGLSDQTELVSVNALPPAASDGPDGADALTREEIAILREIISQHRMQKKS